MIPKPSAQCSRMPMITSGSPKERKNDEQDAGHSQSNCSSLRALRQGPGGGVRAPWGLPYFHISSGTRRPNQGRLFTRCVRFEKGADREEKYLGMARMVLAKNFDLEGPGLVVPRD